MSPWYGHILGGVPVILTVPEDIFDEGLMVTCHFHNVQVKCLCINSYQVSCITPELNITGRVPVKLQHKIKQYKSSFYSRK